ncbi:MAG: hypothetical protein IPO69_08995 [Saprospiraceae bacterium]|nr:hypothetical protein [Saprospiraceae bacterium]
MTFEKIISRKIRGDDHFLGQSTSTSFNIDKEKALLPEKKWRKYSPKSKTLEEAAGLCHGRPSGLSGERMSCTLTKRNEVVVSLGSIRRFD